MKNIKKLFLLFLLIFIGWANYCSALEIQPKDWPNIPFTKPITEASTLPNYIVYFFALGIYVAGAIAVISLAIAGLQLMMSAEDPSKRTDAIGRIRGAIIGLVLLLGSFIIIGTINPQLQTVKTEPLQQIGGIQLTGNRENTPAPMSSYSLDAIKKDYSAISWPQTVQDTAGKTVNNCDPNNPNAIYVIYWYKDQNFKNFWGLNRLKCGQQDTSLSGANSYIIVKEQPGVYFYNSPGCKPAVGGDSSSLPIYSTQSMPDGTASDIVSIRVVNGPDPKNGPFFGAVLFGSQDYKSSAVAYAPFRITMPASDNYSNCFEIKDIYNTSSNVISMPSKSVIIYQWAGFKENGKPNTDNCSVTLYSRPAWTGGYYEISQQSEGTTSIDWGVRELAKTPAMYSPNTTIPKDEQKQCSYFDPKYNCLQSFEIKGNCLVLVTSNTSPLAFVQAFPISPRIAQAYANRPEGYSIERGTPELASEYITSGYAYYLKVIPLAENIVNSQ